MHVAIATRKYGEGNIFIHTDKISGIGTNHGKNDTRFWRKVFEFCTNNQKKDIIKIAVIDNLNTHETFNSISEIKNVEVKNIDFPYIGLYGLNEIDCLYVSGLKSNIDLNLISIITTFIDQGGGLIIENPNIYGNINLISNIELIPVSSIQNPVYKNAYWTSIGSNHYIFNSNVKINFLSKLLIKDFSNKWSILMTDIEVDNSILDDYENSIVLFENNVASEFSISFIVGMQKGIVRVLE